MELKYRGKRREKECDNNFTGICHKSNQLFTGFLKKCLLKTDIIVKVSNQLSFVNTSKISNLNRIFAQIIQTLVSQR